MAVLNDKSEEVEKNNQELKETENQLNQINQNLEEIIHRKTVNVVLQNKKLLHYAHINAHHVRGPLARLLGILQLSEMEEKADYPLYMNMIEKEINAIDEVLKGLSKGLKTKKNS